MLNKIKIPPCFTTKWYYDLGNVLSHVVRKAYESLAPQTHSPPPTRNHALT